MDYTDNMPPPCGENDAQDQIQIYIEDDRDMENVSYRILNVSSTFYHHELNTYCRDTFSVTAESGTNGLTMGKEPADGEDEDPR